MKYLYVTGANGFLGKKIVEYLKDKNWFDRVFLIVRDKNIYFYQNEIFDTLTYDGFYSLSASEEQALDNNDIEKILLHLAFTRSSEPEKLMSSVRLLENVSNACLKNKINKIINVSSQSVYNPYREESAKETDLPSPDSLYGIAKIYTESYLNLFSKKNSISVFHLRLASLAGLGLDNRITTRMLKDAYLKNKINISSSKEQFSYLMVEDAARMLSYIANNLELASHTVYNIGSFESYSLKTIVEIILEIFKDRQLPKPTVNIINSTGAQYNNSLNMDRMSQDFNLKDKISLEESLNDILENLINEAK